MILEDDVIQSDNVFVDDLLQSDNIFTSNLTTQFPGPGVTDDWILTTGFWDDTGVWQDDDFWID